MWAKTLHASVFSAVQPLELLSVPSPNELSSCVPTVCPRGVCSGCCTLCVTLCTISCTGGATPSAVVSDETRQRANTPVSSLCVYSYCYWEGTVLIGLALMHNCIDLTACCCIQDLTAGGS